MNAAKFNQSLAYILFCMKHAMAVDEMMDNNATPVNDHDTIMVV